ncbi:MAG TPA: hypothetical protein VGH19_19825 [Verrucomicrobiae bacterium]
MSTIVKLWFCLAGLLLLPCVSFSQSTNKAVYFTADFEQADWFKAWGEKQLPQNCELVSVDESRKFEPLSGKALRVKVEKDGHYGTSVEYAFKKRTGSEPEEVYFRYYIRLADDWTGTQGGKFPGVGGTYGKAGWGGRPVNGTDGWSARGLFASRREGKLPIGFYCYHMDMKGQYGSEWIWDKDKLGYLENNRWYCIEQYVKLNTVGKADGILRGWVDGKLAFEKTDIRMRAVDTLKVEMVWLNVYYGGTWTAKADYHVYIDEMVISREPIGPRKQEK